MPARRKVAEVPVVPWAEFVRRFDWQQGEHVSLVGSTGSGKSYLGLRLLDRRKWVAVLATKPGDDTLDELLDKRVGRKPVWVEIKKWPPPALRQKVILWPDFRRLKDTAQQRAVFSHAIDEMFAAGSWCMYMDEAYYLSKQLGLEREMKLCWTQGRSIGLSIVAGTQRPAWVPLEMWSQCSHLFMFRSSDKRDLDRVAEMGGGVADVIRDVAPRLGKHEFLYHSTRTGDLLRSRVD